MLIQYLEFELQCYDGSLIVNERDIEKCDYFTHLVNGQRQLNALKSFTITGEPGHQIIHDQNHQSRIHEMIESTKLYPTDLIKHYFQFLKNEKSDKMKISTILQLLGFLFSDGRGEIYSSQSRCIGG